MEEGQIHCLPVQTRDDCRREEVAGAAQVHGEALLVVHVCRHDGREGELPRLLALLEHGPHDRAGPARVAVAPHLVVVALDLGVLWRFNWSDQFQCPILGGCRLIYRKTFLKKNSST